MPETIPDSVNESVARFLGDDYLRPMGLDLYPEIFETDMMFPLQRQCELQAMMRIAQSKLPETVFEIGTDKAGGLYHWVKCLPTVRNVIACEIRGTPYKHLFQEAFAHINFLWLDGISSYDHSSVAIVSNWLTEHDTKIDTLFIDGDKTAFEVDFDSYLPHMREHGIVFMHDVQNDNLNITVRDSWENILKRGYKTEEIVIKTDSDEAMARAKEGIPPANPHEGWQRFWYGRSCGVGVIYL